MQRTLVVIPARMPSTRLPGKPLADIAGTPMIVHVWRRAMASHIGRVVVATDSQEIVEGCETRIDLPTLHPLFGRVGHRGLTWPEVRRWHAVGREAGELIIAPASPKAPELTSSSCRMRAAVRHASVRSTRRR